MLKKTLALVGCLVMLTSLLLACGDNTATVASLTTPPASNTTAPAVVTTAPATTTAPTQQATAAATAASAPQATTAATNGSAKATRTITDMLGNKLEIPLEPTKVAASWPAFPGSMVLFGAKDKLAATYPGAGNAPWFKKIYPQIAQVPTPFSFSNNAYDANIEELLKINPDVVVLLDDSTALIAKLQEVKIPVFRVIHALNFDDLRKTYRAEAEVVGPKAMQRVKDYDAYVDEKLKLLTDLSARIPQEQILNAVLVTNAKNLAIYGGETIATDEFKLAGAKNGVGSTKSGPVSLEQLLTWNPDVLFVTNNQDKQLVLSDPAWQALKAVKNQKVYTTPQGIFVWYAYGPEAALQFQWVAKTIHPEIFKDIDMIKETKDFYKRFYDFDLSDNDVQAILNAQSPG